MGTNFEARAWIRKIWSVRAEFVLEQGKNNRSHEVCVVSSRVDWV
jgi:hypothetical protein